MNERNIAEISERWPTAWSKWVEQLEDQAVSNPGEAVAMILRGIPYREAYGIVRTIDQGMRQDAGLPPLPTQDRGEYWRQRYQAAQEVAEAVAQVAQEDGRRSVPFYRDPDAPE